MATQTANVASLYEDVVADLIPLIIRGLYR
jgi:hypothetical protein